MKTILTILSLIGILTTYAVTFILGYASGIRAERKAQRRRK